MGLRRTQGDEKRFRPATAFHGSFTLPFVIPSEAERSAVPRTFPGNVFRPTEQWKDLQLRMSSFAWRHNVDHRS
jgi:hypothetical protein